MLKKIIFITDGNAELGMGHIYQSTALAKLLSRKAGILFLTQSNGAVIEKINDYGFCAINLDDEKKVKLLSKIKPDVTIIDKLYLEEDFTKNIKEMVDTKLVIFANFSPANKYADVVVGAMVGGTLQKSKYFKDNTKYYNGIKYFIFREEFYKYHKLRKSINSKVEKIVLLFGGADKANLTIPVLETLLKSDYKIDVILSSMYQYKEQINNISDKRVTLHYNTDEVAKLMYESDLCLVSPGLSAFEALCVGTPILAIPQLQYQWDACLGYIKMILKSDINKINDIIERREFSFPHDKVIKEMEIGQGKNELVTEILK
jgi:spore coat polysaccharide biosynthesis predicted glycosyltransferase SpsG